MQRMRCIVGSHLRVKGCCRVLKEPTAYKILAEQQSALGGVHHIAFGSLGSVLVPLAWLSPGWVLAFDLCHSPDSAPVAGVQHTAPQPSLKDLASAAATHCRPLQLEAEACGQPRSVCWRRRRQPARPRGPSMRSRRGPTPGKLCKAAQGTSVVCTGIQAAGWAQGCRHVGTHCSGVCGCSLAGYRCGHGSYSAGCSHLPDVLIVSSHRCLEAV